MDGRQSMVLAPGSAPPNPIAQFQARMKEVETGFRSWLAGQPIHVEVAVVTATSAAQGAALGGLMGTLTSDASAAFSPPPQALTPEAMAALKKAQTFSGGPLAQARNFAVMTGVNAGISCLMKRIRGVDDVQNSMVAAFGSGALFSLVSGMGGPNPLANAISSGFIFSLAQGGFFMLGQRISKAAASSAGGDDVLYGSGREMLARLGLEKYEKNLKKGMLTDTTLPLLTDSALRDAKIPPGPRLLILHHIHRERP